jgi:hypothetical protein
MVFYAEAVVVNHGVLSLASAGSAAFFMIHIHRLSIAKHDSQPLLSITYHDSQPLAKLNTP